MAQAEMTLYDMAKQLVENEKDMDPILLNQKLLEMAHELTEYNYLMLLCHERRDYTLFNILSDDKKKLAKEIAETLYNRGHVLVIDKQPDGAWEIWIRVNNENFAYYLFNYSEGVIEIE